MWIGVLELRPALQAARPGLAGEGFAEAGEYAALELESAEGEAVPAQELRDLGQGQGMLADMQREVAEVARRVEVAAHREVAAGRAGRPVQQDLPERAQRLIAAAGTGIGRIAAQLPQAPPGDGAVEPHEHQAVLGEASKQRAPALERLG